MSTSIPSQGASPRRPAVGEIAELPIIIAEWPRNSRELVRVSLDCFNNRFTVDVRVWWQNADGIFRPDRSGLMLAINHLPKLAHSLEDTLQRAQVLGLLEPRVKRDRTAAERQRRYRQRRR